MADTVGMDDYSLARVPAEARYPWWSIAIQRFGQVSALTQFLLGATLGFGMTFWGAFWALTLGAVILEFVMILVGHHRHARGPVTPRCSRAGPDSAEVGSVADRARDRDQPDRLVRHPVGRLGRGAVRADRRARRRGCGAIVFGLAVTAIVCAASTRWPGSAYVTVPLVPRPGRLVDHLRAEPPPASAHLIASPPPGPA